MKKIILSIFILNALSACATNAPSAKERVAIYENFLSENKILPMKKINSFHYLGWRSLDNEHLIIETTPKKSYLITLINDCHDLRFTHHIAIKQTLNSSLQARFDSILVPEFPHMKCYIKTLHPLTKEQANALAKLVKNPS